MSGLNNSINPKYNAWLMCICYQSNIMPWASLVVMGVFSWWFKSTMCTIINDYSSWSCVWKRCGLSNIHNISCQSLVSVIVMVVLYDASGGVTWPMTTPLTHTFPAARESEPTSAPIDGAAAICHALHMGKAIAGHRRNTTAHRLLCWPDSKLLIS